jgi:TFIIF-interacting CTD phosphatase-like protein
MNRDPSKIIVIDWDENTYQLQPRNALHRLKKWEGDDTDADLVYLASFLKSKYFKTNMTSSENSLIFTYFIFFSK